MAIRCAVDWSSFVPQGYLMNDIFLNLCTNPVIIVFTKFYPKHCPINCPINTNITYFWFLDICNMILAISWNSEIFVTREKTLKEST